MQGVKVCEKQLPCMNTNTAINHRFWKHFLMKGELLAMENLKLSSKNLKSFMPGTYQTFLFIDILKMILFLYIVMSEE